ncbi:cobyrinate a,c-diamide synthase [Cohaesibacter celericrescens]|uniref:Hydrogenobyrinate a,c-diamide synthase n=1 Tax=Cohaesibacter celericrescens TaxID=2067669 RepID=A0A2N5XVV0_9HYPH|nr:cobyrinate a,c-diamide synthase [Cohaesibacter celericrescens]PLW78633.1 cobyrinic acid a,c-diamide synthase [Cohaesibacter celericrescens]
MAVQSSTHVQTGLILAASSSNSGKTTLSLGLQRLLTRRGLVVAPAKCGPDYIDPAFHAVASGATSINLDPWAMRPVDILSRSESHAFQSEFLFVEGVMGLFDGAAGGQGSTANLARILKLPVLLVLDVKGQAQTAAAIAQGLRRFDFDISIGGVLLNRVGSVAHEMLLREAFAKINLPVMGVVRSSEKLVLPSRHLGLIQANEHSELSDRIDDIADHVGQYVDLDAIIQLANSHTNTTENHSGALNSPFKLKPIGQRIAIARDEAFTFIYPHLLSDWQEQGAELSFFSPLQDEAPSLDADAIYLPGGYPELHLDALQQATTFRQRMEDAAARSKCIFAECGGYMVLGRSILSKQGCEYAMLNLLPVTTSFQDTKLKLGYRKLTHSSTLPWGESLTAHEFHYATVTWQGICEPLFNAHSAAGKDLGAMGQRIGSVHGSFAHIIAPA